MLLKDGTVKVMDFGIAKMLATANASTHSVGTLAYMSPEQIDAAKWTRVRTSIVSGLLFYEAPRVAAPFESQSPPELLNLQCTAPPPALPPSVAASVAPWRGRRALRSSLEEAPEDRPDSAGERCSTFSQRCSRGARRAARRASFSAIEARCRAGHGGVEAQIKEVVAHDTVASARARWCSA